MSTAIVVGAGIGGVSAAVALQQHGWQVTVLERAPELGEVGAGISLWPSAVAALGELGVTGVEKAAASAAPAGMRRPSGQWVVEATDLGVEIPVMIHRARLHELITARFGPDVSVRTGVSVTGLRQDASGVTVLAGETEHRADLVVAADGIRSVVRQALHPQYAGPRYAGYTAYRGIAEVDVADGGGETWGRGRRFGFAKLLDGRFYWYATANRPAGAPPGAGGPHGDALAQFGDWHEPIPTLLAHTEPGRVLQNDLYDLPLPLVPFVTGRVVLLGDAAHAMTPNLGRGACTAIEDAAALARQVGGSPPDLAAYDRERRPVGATLVRRSRIVGRLGQVENPVACAVRDGVLRAGGTVAGLLGRRRGVRESGRDHSSAGG